MDHFFPVELIHRHEHFGHKAKGMLYVYGNETVDRAGSPSAAAVPKYCISITDSFPRNEQITP